MYREPRNLYKWIIQPAESCALHQQPEVNYLHRFSPQLISLERYTLSVYRAGEIELFGNLDIVHIRLLVEESVNPSEAQLQTGGCSYDVNALWIQGSELRFLWSSS